MKPRTQQMVLIYRHNWQNFSLQKLVGDLLQTDLTKSSVLKSWQVSEQGTEQGFLLAGKLNHSLWAFKLPSSWPLTLVWQTETTRFDLTYLTLFFSCDVREDQGRHRIAGGGSVPLCSPIWEKYLWDKKQWLSEESDLKSSMRLR